MFEEIANLIDAIADAMNMALIMPLQERRERHLALKEKVMRTTADVYCRRFIDALEAKPAARTAAVAAA